MPLARARIVGFADVELFNAELFNAELFNAELFNAELLRLKSYKSRK